MKNVHLLIPDLFLPQDLVASTGLHLPMLEKMLARGSIKRLCNIHDDVARTVEQLGRLSLESLLCRLFDVPMGNPRSVPASEGAEAAFCRKIDQGSGMNALPCNLHLSDAPIAPISAVFDGVGEGCWMRADPVHLRLQRDQLLLLPNVKIDADEAEQLCAAVNEHFVGQHIELIAPHPQRWYLRVDRLPDIQTLPLSQAVGRNVRSLLPSGKEAMYWHGIFNEIQMLLFAHPVNQAREARGDLPLNSLWFWGGGEGNAMPKKTYAHVSSDEVLAEMFAASAGIPFSVWQSQWKACFSGGKRECSSDGGQLLVFTALRSALQYDDLDAWRTNLLNFETAYMQPLWQALRAGKIAQLQLDILGGDCIMRLLLTRADTWAFWRPVRPLAQYSVG